MPNTIQIKRRDAADDNAPPSLAQGELAYNEHHQYLYLGGVAASQDVVAGAGAFARNPTATGFIVLNALRSGATPPTTVNRLVAGTANQLTVTNGDGVAGNPTLTLPTDVILPGTGAIKLPVGLTGQQPTSAAGLLRYNSTDNIIEWNIGASWVQPGTATNSFGTLVPDSGGSVVSDAQGDTATLTGGTGIDTVGTPASDIVTFNLNVTGLAALAAAPATGDELPLQDVSAGTVKKMTVANLFTSPALTGSPTAPTAAQTDNDTSVATTAFVRAVRLDQFAVPTAAVAFNAQQLTGLAAGSADDHAVTLSQLNSVASGIDWKASVRLASTADVAGTYTAAGGISARGQFTLMPNALDGVNLAANDRILLKDQTPGAEKGLWVVTTLGTGANGVWDRATDADADAEVTGGMAVWVNEGTTNADTGWVLTTDDPITIGGASGTILAFTQFSGLGQITAGTGLTKTGNTIDAIGTASRISVSANAIDIDAAYVGQASIITLGTITTGTWTGTAIAAVNGGTAQTTWTTGDIMYASGANTLAKLTVGATDTLLKVVGGVPTWSATLDGGTF